MWQRRSHMLVPLTKLTSINRKIEWMEVKQDAFEKTEMEYLCFWVTHDGVNPEIKKYKQ